MYMRVGSPGSNLIADGRQVLAPVMRTMRKSTRLTASRESRVKSEEIAGQAIATARRGHEEHERSISRL